MWPLVALFVYAVGALSVMSEGACEVNHEREQLPDVADADNPIIWCDRCQRHHRRWTFTRSDYDRMIAKSVDTMAARIDKEILDKFVREFNAKDGE